MLFMQLTGTKSSLEININSNENSVAYDCQPHHQHHECCGRDREMSRQLHQKPTLHHPTTTVCLVLQSSDCLGWVNAANHSTSGTHILVGSVGSSLI